jgi:hypothetical protein
MVWVKNKSAISKKASKSGFDAFFYPLGAIFILLSLFVYILLHPEKKTNNLKTV